MPQVQIKASHLDLFSGIGGFSIAAQAAGFTTIAFCEIEPFCQQVLKEKFGAVLADSAGSGTGESKQAVYGADKCVLRRRKEVPTDAVGCRPTIHPDIFALNGADYLGVDLITGGFPCQPYSCAGKRRGAEDHRAIWPEMRRIIAEARPAWVLGENVPGIINMELDRVLSDLEAIGYACWPLVVPACAVDARHRRDRVWIVACRDDQINIPKWQGELQRSKQRTGNKSGVESLRQGEDVGHSQERTIGTGLCQDEPARNRRGRSGDTSRKIATNTGCELLEGRKTKPEERPVEWLPEPDVGRVAHGIPHRAHRLRALGNAIVPKVAEVIIREIARLINHDFTVRIETNKPNSL